MRARRLLIHILCIGAIILSGCGKKSSDTAAPPAPETVFSGLASKGPVGGATVTVFPIRFGAVDTTPIGQGQTDASGNFTVNVGTYQGPAVVEVTGGTFTDEATGGIVSLNVPLHTAVPDAHAGATIPSAVTPLTELAFKKAKGGGPLIGTSINAANVSVGSMFGVGDIVGTLPDAAGETVGQKKYAAACSAFSGMINANRAAGETTDDATTRLITRLGNEMESGGLSMDSITMLNRAITASNGVINPLPMPTSGLVRLTTSGAAAVIAGVDVTVSLPAGVTVNADPVTGEVAAGVITPSGAVAAAGGSAISLAKFTPPSAGAPASLHIIVVNSTGYSLGEFATVKFSLASGAAFPLTSDFTVTSFAAKALNGTGLTGITAGPSSTVGVF